MRFFALTLFLILSRPALALNIQAFVDKSEIFLNESLVFTIKIQSQRDKPKNLDIPDLSHLADFYLLNQWSGRKSSINWRDGRMERTDSLLKNFSLQPKKIGALKIPALDITADGKTLKTSAISINVVKGSSPLKPRPKASPFWPPSLIPPSHLFDFFEDPFDEPKESSSGSIHLEAHLSKKLVYKSEGIRVDWVLFQSSSSGNYSVHVRPSLKGFWKENLKKQEATSLGTELREQVLYRKTLLEGLWLFPLRTGELTIDPYVVQAERIFGFRFQEKFISSLPGTVRVRDLPPPPLESSFTGAVGDWNVKAFLSESTAEVHEPLSYKIVFEGRGHPRFISLPELELPSSAQTYPPVAKSRFFDSGKGRKEFEILIIPQKEGTLTIPSQSLSVFESSTGQYIEHKTSPFSLSVQKGKTKPLDELTFFEEEEEEPLLLPPSLQKTFWPSFINHKNLMIFWFSFLAVGLLVSLILFGLLLKRKMDLQKKSSLKKKIEREFKNIQSLLEKKNWRKAGSSLIQVNNLLLCSSPQVSSSLGWRETLKKLPPTQNKKYFSEFESLFKDLENLSFAPQSLSEKSALNRAESLFKRSKILSQSFLSSKK